ncbi:hypothetical protein SAMN02927916_2139 [Flavobacterium anhuiense]|uniref:Uncharacterized protein n=1 Tax=Flavobacterium anhuiense TaxID=459526 RepID=A0ABY0LP16_9FLAO|nr:hypothetical protein SAMN02927916_2139 [Flavobacterium anhuiense]
MEICYNLYRKAEKNPILREMGFKFVTSTGQITTSFLDDLKRLAYYI